MLPVSAVTGEGLDALRERARRHRARAGAAPGRWPGRRLPVDRAFSMKGFGTVVTGTLASGAVAIDDELELLPAGTRVKVRGLHVHGRARPTAAAGERVAMNLAGVDVAEVARGSVVAAPAALRATRRLDARITMLPGAGLKHGARVRVHQGTAEALARVSVAGASGLVAPGASADVRLRFESPAVVTRGDRFILRSYSPLVTIGGGAVLDPLPPRAGVRTPRGVARMAALQLRGEPTADRRAAVGVMAAGAGIQGLTVAELAARTGVARAELARLLERDGSRRRGGSGGRCGR